MSDAENRQERFSKSRQFAKELVADSIITDAAAQFIALMIEEIHKTKIKPLHDELARRADLPPTPAQIMADLRVKALVEAGERMRDYFTKCRNSDVYAVADFDAAVAAIKEPKP